jgi:hypothetical protein
MAIPLTEALSLKKSEIPYYDDFISPAIKANLLKTATAVEGVAGLQQVGASGGLENKDSFKFLCELYESVKGDLNLGNL